MSKSKFTLIKGGFCEHEKLFQRLLSEPHKIEQSEFDHLLDNIFRDRLTYAETMHIINARRALNASAEDSLEDWMMRAFLRGDEAEYKRLGSIVMRKNALGLKLIKTTQNQCLAISSK